MSLFRRHRRMGARRRVVRIRWTCLDRIMSLPALLQQPEKAKHQAMNATSGPLGSSLSAHCRPPVIFGEQVEAAIGWGWLDLVCSDMGAEGYTVGAAVLPACSVGAPHIRQRLWFVGHSECDQFTRTETPEQHSWRRKRQERGEWGLQHRLGRQLLADHQVQLASWATPTAGQPQASGRWRGA